MVPYLELIRKGKKGPKDAIYAISSFDEIKQVEYVKAYKLNINGKLELLDEDYTQSEFDNQSISGKAATGFVYSLLLKPCDDGIYQKTECDSGGGYTPPLSNDLNIKQIRISDKKESWIERADIKFTGAKIRFNGTQFNRTFSIANTSPYINVNGVEHALLKIRNGDLGSLKTINFKVGQTSQVFSFIFSIYEHDSSPAPLQFVKTSILNYPCTCEDSSYSNLRYRPYQTPYIDRAYSFGRTLDYGIGGTQPAFGRNVRGNDLTSSQIIFSD